MIWIIKCEDFMNDIITWEKVLHRRHFASVAGCLFNLTESGIGLRFIFT